MPWFFFIIISRLFDTASVIYAKKVLTNSKINPISFAIGFQFFTGIIIGIYGVFTSDFNVLPGKDFPWFNIALLVLLYSFSNVYYYKAMETVEASKLSIILTSSSIFSIITGFIFLGEVLTPLQYIGGCIVFVGIVLANLEKMKLNIGQGEIYLLFCAICWGIELVNDKVLIGSLGIYLFLFLGYTLPAIFMFLIYRKDSKQIPKAIKLTGYWKFLIFCLIYLAQSVFFYWGMSLSATSGLVVILNLASRVFTIVASVILLKETKNLWQKFIAITIVIIGLYILN
jgi:drug/metabolite transporter (DMT)-like permease